ncbi:MAG: hypothetical protein AB1554_00245 [Chloroflexota bacterium]
MSDFWVNFLANLSADFLLAIMLYIILTRPDERRKEKEAMLLGLGLLKNEIEVNAARCKEYIAALKIPTKKINDLFPLRYRRSTWNSLKDSGFLGQLNDPQLAYYLFTMNEITFIANRNLRRFQLSFIDDPGEKTKTLAQIARNDGEHLLVVLEEVLKQLAHIKSISVSPLEDAFEEDDDIEANRKTSKPKSARKPKAKS